MVHLWEFAPKISKQQFCHNVSSNVRTLWCCNFTQKNQKNLMHQLAIKDSFWLPFVQNPRARFPPKKSFWVNSKPLCCCTSWKYQKTHALNFNNTCKPLFRSILDPFGTIRSQKSYFQKKIFINLHLYTAVSNFKQKIRKVLKFHWLLMTPENQLFSQSGTPFGLKTSTFFQKKLIYIIFESTCCCNFK